MNDCIGREIKINDYVTAPFYSGTVSLFRVIEIHESGSLLGANKARRRIQRVDEAVLERTWKNSEIKADMDNKKVLRESDQITLVDSDYVMLYFLTR